MPYQLFSDWKDQVSFSPQAVQPRPLFMDDQFKVIMAGLEPGQSIPQHPEGLSVYYILEGQGVMTVDGEPVEVAPGAVLVLPDGAVRGLEAKTRLAFLAARVAQKA